MRILAAFSLAALCGACVSTEGVRFQPKPQQEAMIRDGNPALVSRQKHSIVLIRPARREFAIGSRPVFVVAAHNLGSRPTDLKVENIQVVQVVNQQSVPLKVITYENLVTEERNRQIFAAVVTGLAAGANAAAASQQGRVNYSSTTYTPYGTYQTTGTAYSPALAAAAQDRANYQNAEMIAATVERGQQNMAHLEKAVIKDNTLLPGEWYGGQLHISPPSSEQGGRKTYVIAMTVGADRHEIEVTQESNK